MSNVHIATTSEESSVLVEKMQLGDITTFGFDTETTISRTEHGGRTSTVQLHSGYECYIFQVYRIWKSEGAFPPKLSKFLSNPLFIKVGVASEGDARRLEEGYDIKCSGVVDIQHIARSIHVPNISMEGLASKYVPFLSKGNKSNIYTDWDTDLNEKHIKYAATDALLSLLIYRSIFHPPPVSEPKRMVLDDSEEDNALLKWLSTGNRLPARSTDTVINMICNSYGRWAKLYTRTEKVAMAQSSLERLISTEKLRTTNGRIYLT